MQKIASSISLIQGRFATSLPKLTDGDVLLIYTFALLAGGYIRRVLDAYLHAEESATFYAAAQINAGELLAFVAIATVLRSKIDPVRLSKVDFVITSVCALFLLLPKQGLPFVGATIAGLYFWRRRPPNAQLASAAQLWLAISFYRFWGTQFFQIISVPVVQAEAFVIGKIGQLLGFGLTMEGVRLYGPNRWFVYIMEGCSSFHNASLAGLAGTGFSDDRRRFAARSRRASQGDPMPGSGRASNNAISSASCARSSVTNASLGFGPRPLIRPSTA